jgi:hypothetical protein
VVEKLNSEIFKQAKSIIINHLDKNSKIMDLCCGEDSFTKWLKNNDQFNFVSLTKDAFKHLNRENSFVAYNNFVNDERLLPTDSKADIILLMGPLYSMQDKNQRTNTLNEVKSLLNPKGKIFTLGICKDNTKCDNINANFKEDKKQLEEAGFKVEAIEKFTTKNKNENSYVTVATVKAVPKPVLSVFDIPPEVIINIPKKNFELKNSIDKTLSIKKEKLLSPALPEKATLHRLYNSLTEVKPSIDVSLQKNIQREVKESIDKTLQPPKKQTSKSISLKLPILPKVILDEYNISSKEISSTPITNNDNSQKEITLNEEVKECKEPHLPITASIDKNLVVRENKEEIIKEYKEKAEKRKIHKSIDKTLQMRIPKINPKYAKAKSRKKGTQNLIKYDL